MFHSVGLLSLKEMEISVSKMQTPSDYEITYKSYDFQVSTEVSITKILAIVFTSGKKSASIDNHFIHTVIHSFIYLFRNIVS